MEQSSTDPEVSEVLEVQEVPEVPDHEDGENPNNQSLNYQNLNENQNEDDPLGVKKLALNFDYLLFKINEHVSALAEQTRDSVQNRQRLIDGQLVDVDTSIDALRELISSCEDLELELLKIEQISYIVTDFRERIRQLESYVYNR